MWLLLGVHDQGDTSTVNGLASQERLWRKRNRRPRVTTERRNAKNRRNHLFQEPQKRSWFLNHQNTPGEGERNIAGVVARFEVVFHY